MNDRGDATNRQEAMYAVEHFVATEGTSRGYEISQREYEEPVCLSLKIYGDELHNDGRVSL